jgi:ankyrin repeat protein
VLNRFNLAIIVIFFGFQNQLQAAQQNQRGEKRPASTTVASLEAKTRAEAEQQALPLTSEGLLEAARTGNIAEIRRLVHAGIPVDPEKINENDFHSPEVSALMVAAENGQIDAIRELIDLGADPEITDEDEHRTALRRAADGGKIEAIIELINLGAKVDGRHSEDALTPFISAIQANEIAAAEKLLELGADIDAIDLSFGTALMQNAESGEIEHIIELIRMGADINKKHYDKTALTYAAQGNQSQAVVTLLKAGAVPDEIFWEEAKKHPEVMDAIKKYMAEHEKRMENITARAIESGSKGAMRGKEIAKEVRKYLEPSFYGLIEPKPTIQSEQDEKEEKEGKSSDYEMRINNTPIQNKPNIQIPLMQAEQMRLNNLLLSGIKQKDTTVDMVNGWLNLNAQIGSQDTQGYTPLMLAVIYNRPDIVDVLLEGIRRQNDPDFYLNMTDNAGDTALTWAERLRKNDLFAKLIRAGATKIS